MQLNQLITDDDAVSPVIGVILMVAITVILAAVIATFVLGLGEQISDTSPSATFDFDYDSSVDPDELTITHTGGDTIQAGNLYARGSSVESEEAWTEIDDDNDYDADSDIGAGQSLTLGVDSDDTVRVVWQTSEGDQTSTLQVWEGPDA